tara:strand:+ start:1859 stop:2074 length:216 start_codon:yes stop_codon:yes gene_type:complete
MKLYIEIDLEKKGATGSSSRYNLSTDDQVIWPLVAVQLDRLRDRLLANKYEKKRGAIENVDEVVIAYMEEN